MIKFVLDLTRAEALQEISTILGRKITLDKITGRIADTKDEYVTNGVVDVNKLSDLYNDGKYVDEYVATLAVTSLTNRASDLFRLVRNVSGTVLEYGCGTSTHGLACAQRGCEVHAVDMSDKMLWVSKERYKLRSLPVMTYKPDDELPQDYFDTVLCTDVLEHVPDPVALLYKLINSMKIGGVAHLHCSTMKNYKKGHLPDAIDAWFSDGTQILKNNFKKISEYNYRLICKP
jgi:2-polyprenyl-3-methyl-5-hydroxy-6-metoxy-1,4-benzoquinol methylase